MNCETDFVAKTEKFQEFVKNIAMQIAAAKPEYIRKEEVLRMLLKRKRNFKAQALNEGKPEKIVDKMVEGRIEKYYKDVCLLEQPYIKDGDKSVSTLLNETIAEIGENINIRRFVRYELGEGLEKKSCDFASEVMAELNK